MQNLLWTNPISLPQDRFYVLDMNVMRRPEIVTEAINSLSFVNGYVVVPDIGFMEMLKGSDWEYNLRRSTEVICNFPDRVLYC